MTTPSPSSFPLPRRHGERFSPRLGRSPPLRRKLRHRRRAPRRAAPGSACDSLALETRADLDIIKVGCWGNVISITDPALADSIGDSPLLGASNTLRERYPDARIVGSANVHCGGDHTEDIIQLPGGLMLHAEGWSGVEPLEVTGDPQAVVRALGISSETLAEEAIDLDGESDEVDWRALGRLALGPCDPWGRVDLRMSVFRVRHTSSSTFRMEESWFL